MRSGFGGKQGSISGRSIGKQDLVDRAGSKHSLIRAIGGGDILTWIDATSTSNTLGSNLTNSTIDVIEGSSPTVGSQVPSTEFSTVLNTTAYSFQSNGGVGESLSFPTSLIPASTNKITVASRFCITAASLAAAHIIWEIGNINGFGGVDGGAVHGIIDVSGDKFWSGIGDVTTSEDSFFLSTEVPEVSRAYAYVSTHDTVPDPDQLKQYLDGKTLIADSESDLTGDTEYNFSTSVASYMGARVPNSSAFSLKGHLSDFIIMKRKLTEGESQRLSKALSS